MNRSNMALVRVITVLLVLCRICIASNLPIYIEDSHAGSFEFFANRLDLDESYTLVLFDAHSDASAVDGSDRVRAALRNVRSAAERLSVTQSLRDSGRIQPYNWIESLMPRPISRVIWIPGDGFSSNEIAEIEQESRKHLDWKLQVDERDCGRLGPEFVVKNFSQVQSLSIDQRLLVSVDMDIYAQDSVDESDFDSHWQWIIKQPKLEALSFALSRPWLRSDEQADRFMVAVFQKCFSLGNTEIQYEPYRFDRRDRSLKAKEFLKRGVTIPRFNIEECSPVLSDLLLQNTDRVTVESESGRWRELIDQWMDQFSQIKVHLNGLDQCIDGVWRTRIQDVSDIWLQYDGEVTSIKWWLLEPDSSAYDVLPKVSLGKSFTSSRVTSFVSEKRKLITETTDLVLSADTWGEYLPVPHSSGVIRLQAEVTSNDALRISEVIELRVSSRNGFLGALSEQFGSPYIFGIGSITHKGERGGEALLGNDCANFLIYGFRQVGLRYEWGNPKQLRQQLSVLAADCDNSSRIVFDEQNLEDGLVLDFGEHVAALWQDNGDKYVLEPEDLVVHHLGGFPEILPLSNLISKYRSYAVLTPDLENDPLTLCFGGDVNLDGASAQIFSKTLREVINAADLAVINLECAINEEVRGEGGFCFVAPPQNLDYLMEAGIDGVVIANNHVYDAGSEGLTLTLEHVIERGMVAIGVDSEDTILKIGNHRVGIVAFDAVLPSLYNAETRVLQYSMDRERIENEIRELREDCDSVIVMPHWGNEYTTKVSDEQKMIAKWLVRVGADAVIGSHTHIRQKIEYYRGVPIVYSLGNMYFPSKGPKGFNDYAALQVKWYGENNYFEMQWIKNK
ncbi:CapA family protein [Rubritalea sp.]|uniref:CapA family protein n=1 Tax=Rubritalea sp. TaxID=2109375 RepID=UPI003EF65794